MHQRLAFFNNKIYFLFLLPFFFVLHGVLENFSFVPLSNAAALFAIYAVASFALFVLFWLVLRNITKAALFATAVMALHFFFGSLHDFLKRLLPGSLLSKYSFLLPFLLVLFIVLFVVLKKWNKSLGRISFFLNVALLLFISIDTGLLLIKAFHEQKSPASLPAGFKDCRSCPKPDIYFIIADEYAGTDALDTLFHFDNRAFTDRLGELGFTIARKSNSNYNYTPFAVASILDMGYLDLSGTGRGKTDLAYCYRKIKENRTLQFLRSQGYAFHNFSVFDFEGQPARTRETFLPARTRLITSQTLLSRFDRDIRFNLITRFKSKQNLKIITYANRENNEHLFDLTMKVAEQRSSSPKFVYAHLMMPHYPYYYDSTGREQPFESLLEGNQVNTQAYISYLKYTNKKLLDLVSHIKKVSAAPPVIILMGDHGFRHFSSPVRQEYYFQNLLTVHLPPGTNSVMPDNVTGVNVFRNVFNNLFGQDLPYLPDRTIYLAD